MPNPESDAMMKFLVSPLAPAYTPYKVRTKGSRPWRAPWLGLLVVSSCALAPLAATAGILKIQLPPETHSFKPGPGSELANGQCLVCHSVDYVVMQPPFSRAVWTAEVKKMADKYGAQLPADQVGPIIDYLVRTYGNESQTPATNAAQNGTTSAVASVPAADMSGQGLANHYGCLTCHGVDKKIVGPAYQDVAAKYRNDSQAFVKISQQIHKGGSGKWGPAIMPPFPMVTDAEAKLLADWILTQK